MDIHFKPGQPIVLRQDWLAFSNNLSRYFKKAIGREATEMPYWLAPLAKGVIVASPTLLRVTGYKYGKRRHKDWIRLGPDAYQRTVGKTRLRVRRTNDGRLWIISRWPAGVNMRSDRASETLVHLFGSTPLVADELSEALHLAHWFEVNTPIASLRWAEVCHGNHELIGAIALAMRAYTEGGLKITWNDLWASTSRSRRMKKGRRRDKNGVLLLPTPTIVRPALSLARSKHTLVAWR